MIPTMLAQLVSVPIGPRWLIEYSWLIWFIAAILAHLGLNFLWRSLFRDPDRKKRRCPKCWYDMTGVTALRCPECGNEQASEKKLHKSRRKGLRVTAALTVLLIALSIAFAPRVAARGWVGAIPTAAILTASFVYDTEDLKLFEEVTKRSAAYLYVPSASTEAWPPFMRRMFLVRARSVLMMPAAPQSNPMQWKIEFARQRTLSQVSSLPNSEFDVLAAVIPAINHPDPAIQLSIIKRLQFRFPAASAQVRPALRQALTTNDPAVFAEAAIWLSKQPNDPQDIAAIVQGVRRHRTGMESLLNYRDAGVDAVADFLADPNLALIAMQQLYRVPPADRQTSQVIHAIRTSPNEQVRATGVRFLSSWQAENPEVLRTFLEVLNNEQSELVQFDILQYLARQLGAAQYQKQGGFRIPVDELVPLLTRRLSAQTPHLRQHCAQALSTCGAAAAPALPMLQTIADDSREQPAMRHWASRAIKSINAASRGETLPAETYPQFNHHPARQLPSAPVPGTVPPPSPAPSPSP